MNKLEEQAYRTYLASRKASNKTNYYLESLKEIKEIQKEFQDRKPKLLLHACCAVCASWPLEFLSEVFDLTVYFNNSNIYPQTEYTRRFEELKRYLKEEFQDRITVIDTPYHYDAYMERLKPFKDDPEGWRRCFICYSVRMDEAYAYASEHGYDFFTTVMSISRQKDSQKMNEIGHSLSLKYPNVRYFYSDFKKGGGQVRKNELVAKHDLYRQDYCGCEYSLPENRK